MRGWRRLSWSPARAYAPCEDANCEHSQRFHSGVRAGGVPPELPVGYDAASSTCTRRGKKSQWAGAPTRDELCPRSCDLCPEHHWEAGVGGHRDHRWASGQGAGGGCPATPRPGVGVPLPAPTMGGCALGCFVFSVTGDSLGEAPACSVLGQGHGPRGERWSGGSSGCVAAPGDPQPSPPRSPG